MKITETNIQDIQEQIEKKDLALKALIMWITTDLSNALDGSFTPEELREIHQSTADPALQDKTIDEIVRDALYPKGSA